MLQIMACVYPVLAAHPEDVFWCHQKTDDPYCSDILIEHFRPHSRFAARANSSCSKCRKLPMKHGNCPNLLWTGGALPTLSHTSQHPKSSFFMPGVQKTPWKVPEYAAEHTQSQQHQRSKRCWRCPVSTPDNRENTAKPNLSEPNQNPSPYRRHFLGLSNFCLVFCFAFLFPPPAI